MIYCGYNKYEDHVRPEQREWTLRVRGLDFAEAEVVFVGASIDIPDLRQDYGELRIRTVGYLRGRMVVVVWTQRGDARHVMPMRKANDREQEKYGGQIPEDRERHEEG